MEKLRILLADDHGVLRAGLKALIASQPELEVVGEAETAEVAVRLARDLKPDLAVVDVRMPGDGLAAARRMKQELPEVRVLILSQYDDPAYLRQALAAGASGYALKRASGQELLGAIQAVARGDVYLHPAMTRLLVEESWGPREPAAVAVQSLSEREAQVLRLIALGYTTQQVAGQLFLSVRTVPRTGLCLLLNGQPDVTVVGEAISGDEARQRAHDVQPYIVLMDMSMPGTDALEGMRGVKYLSGERMLALAMHEEGLPATGLER